MPTPRVSILLPARDAAPWLPACLTSLLRQTFTAWECLIVDDGSADGTGELIREWAVEDARIRLLSPGWIGLVAALQAGLQHCRGAYVARMDADDLMHRSRLGEQVRALDAHPAWDGVGCHVRLFPRVNLGPGWRSYEAWLNGIDSAEAVRREAFVECPVAHPTLMLRREVATRFGYRDLGWPEDYDLVLRLLGAGRALGVVPRRLLSWRHRPGRWSQVSPDYRPDRFTACKAHHLAHGLLAARADYVLWGYGATGRALRRELATLGKRPTAIVELHPGRLGQRIHGAEVVAPSELTRLRGLPLIASVAGSGPRRQIRELLTRLGHIEGVDFVCAA